MSVAGAVKALFTSDEDLVESIAKVRSEIRKLEVEVDRAQRGRLPAEEISSVQIPEVVAGHAAAWRRQHAAELLVSLGTYGRKPQLPDWAARPFTSFLDMFDALSVAAPTAAAALLESFRAAEDYQPGPPSTERPAAVARLQGELAALLEQEASLIDTAIARNVTKKGGGQYSHRPETLQRRAAEKAATQTDTTREDALNQRDAARGPVRSPYLARERGR